MTIRIYAERLPSHWGTPGAPAYELGEDDDYRYVMMVMIFNYRLVMVPKDDPMMWEWGWCFSGPKELLAGLHVWNPDTQHEPLGWKKRPTELRSRVAPQAEEDPEYNRFRCIHGDYPEDGPCSKAHMCKVDMRRLEEERTMDGPRNSLSSAAWEAIFADPVYQALLGERSAGE